MGCKYVSEWFLTVADTVLYWNAVLYGFTDKAAHLSQQNQEESIYGSKEILLLCVFHPTRKKLQLEVYHLNLTCLASKPSMLHIVVCSIGINAKNNP